MSVKELILKDDPIEIKVSDSNLKDCPLFVILNRDIELARLCLDRSQAHLLMLWLQERLK